jgi:hypothetical protein
LQRPGECTPLYAALALHEANKSLDSFAKFILCGARGARVCPRGQGRATGDSGWIVNANSRDDATVAASPGALQPNVFA